MNKTEATGNRLTGTRSEGGGAAGKAGEGIDGEPARMTHGLDSSVGTDCGSGAWDGGGGQRGKNWDNSNRTTMKSLKNKKK